ncbi:hypothetical protein L914_18395 [Phytophthora nicotianae]|uniref:Uncharacterized protein n=1 Tax=Phytophthora nicotianae TaxID=4792 RepID=W2I3X9_PHYNI|nr:hypothetical protein L916_18484 [Phytophthora nicotianae]ETM34529.1 hypothetical protein L914_18395 [Phytophthora nicotianae]
MEEGINIDIDIEDIADGLDTEEESDIRAGLVLETATHALHAI